ncbi:GerAB/ArcD/ProY family transporter [Mesobacillus jeotgali]|jgi:spore germination protein (amino acid permease)|uniref:GerAB/ArcD/ProY family transporter n=1 Tax=Mesobacillus jeotgali TaxID=129985 RepID=A0ABY9VFG4_9BACI|nr:GerAB/ArcD/ProY family transporter [Mesobacillus jeotgali]WNF22565.1 GerAB/ArcD/ProY family transporter [Mesobacillus jeotgali]
MRVHIEPKPQNMVNTFLLFFVIHSMQLGVGIQGFQRIIYMEARHDAWVSVILSGIATATIGFFMVKTLSLYENTDLYGIQYDLLGKWLGNLINIVFVVYFLGSFHVIVRNYIEVIQAWVFPEIPNWLLSLTLVYLVYYGLNGGLRTVVGVSFFSVVLSLWLILLLAYPFQFTNWDYLFPMFEAKITEILRGAKQMTFTVIGFEIIYVIYPFLKEKDRVHKYMQYGLGFTTLLYLALMVVSLAYFSGGQLERTIWGTLSLFKIVRFPFIERFEYVAITFWVLLILPNLMLYMWAATRGISRIFNKKEQKVSWMLLLFVFLTLLYPLTRAQINMFNDYFARGALYIVFVYPLFLFGAVLIKKKLSRKKDEANEQKNP